MFCNNCDKEIDDKAVVCPFCGVQQNAVMVVEKAKKPVNGLGVAGFVVSLLSIYFGILFCIAPIVGLILGILGFRVRDKYSAKGLAIAGLVIGIITTVMWVTIFVVLLAVLL